MRIARLVAGLMFALAGICVQAQTTEQEISVTGKLSRVMAIGAESTGWAIELDPAMTIGGKQLSSIQVRYPKTKKLEKLADKHVTATGKLGQQTGVETGTQPVLNISSIKESKAATAAVTPGSTFKLSGTDWKLEDLGVVAADHGTATLSFPESGKIAGNGSCNRFFGSAEINGDAIKLGGMGSTRMACPEPVMTQESKYLEALQAAERFEWKDPYLLVYCKGLDKPLRFTRMVSQKPATP
jgi:heat shock protein HslJ